MEVHEKSKSVVNDLKKVRGLVKVATNRTNYEFSGPTIIYCLTRDGCEKVARELQDNGFQCAFYHAGMSVSNRKKVHEDFLFDRVKCISATVAFGMGVDKERVRGGLKTGFCHKTAFLR